MAKQKFTCNATFVFYADDFQAAQNYVLNQLRQNLDQTKMVVQRCDLVGWTNPTTGQPVTDEDDE